MVPRVNQAADAVGRLANDLPQIDLFRGQGDASARDPGNIEQIVEQADHVRDLAIHDVMDARDQRVVRAGAPQQSQCGADGRQGIAQLVPEHRQEFVFLPRRLGERESMLAQGRFRCPALGDF